MKNLTRTARMTGLLYLAFVVTGVIGYLLIRSNLYVEGDAAATTTNLTDHETLARWGIVIDLGIVAAQALVALWFFKLFRGVNAVAAGAITAFGLINATVILIATALTATAVNVATGNAVALGGDQEGTAQLLYQLSDSLWGVGSLFFGLWLIPMGYAAFTSGLMPRSLGAVVMAGGVGYLLSAIVTHGAPGLPEWVSTALTMPATVGEFWILGYLLIVGVRPAHHAATRELKEQAA